MFFTLSATKVVASGIRASIAALKCDMRQPSTSMEELRDLETRCKELFADFASLQGSSYAMDDVIPMFDILTEMSDLFEIYVNYRCLRDD